MSKVSLIDTNVLIYAFDNSSPFHEPSKRVRNLAISGELPCCVCHQVLFEFFAVSTSKKRVSTPLTPEESLEEINIYLEAPMLGVIFPPVNVFRTINELNKRYQVSAQEIFDLHLVATMLSNNISSVYTFDTAIFDNFDEIKVIKPS